MSSTKPGVTTSYFCDRDGRLAQGLTTEALRDALAAGEGLIWVDMEDARREESAPLLSEVFRFHPLAVDDCFNRHVDPPKVDDYGDYLFVITQGVDIERRSDRLQTTELDIFLGANFVVSLHQRPIPGIEALRRRCAENGTLMERGPDFLAHELIDVAVDSFMPAVEEMDDVLEQLEAEVIREPTQDTLQQILLLKRNAQRIRRTVLPQRDVVNRFARGEFPKLVRKEHEIYYRDIYDHVVRVEDMIESLRDLSDSALNTYLSSVNNRMNEVMKVMSIVAAIFLPLNLLAGIYGTNFENLPELGWRWAYFGMLGLMTAIAAGLIGYFRWRRWF